MLFLSLCVSVVRREFMDLDTLHLTKMQELEQLTKHVE